MHYKARQVLRNLFSSNQGNSSEMTLVTGATKSTSKFENLTITGWLNARNNLKASISSWLNFLNIYDEQQLYITKMMMLIFSIFVMSSYLYLVCLLYRVLKKTYFKQHLSVVASKYSLSDTQNNTQSKLCSMFQYSPNENGIVYGPNGI